MKESTLEERVKTIEHQLAVLQQIVMNGTQAKDWRSTIGMFTGDELMKQIDERARRIRAADRRNVRQPRQRKKPTKR